MRTVKTERRSVENVHILRGIAALLVVLLHGSEQFEQGAFALPLRFGNVGVDIFFVISGFVMVYSSAFRPRSAGAFMHDRLIRIVPMYWAFTTLTVVLALTAPSVFRGTAFDPMHALMSYLFVAWPHPINEGSLSPILRVGWTLNYEMLFYVFFSAAIALRSTARVPIALGMLLGLVALRAVLGDGPMGHFYTSGIMLEFGMGMLLAVAYVRGSIDRLPVGAGGAALVLGALGLVVAGNHFAPDDAWRALWFGVPAALIMTGGLTIERLRRAPVGYVGRYLGDVSYVLYLSHPFVLSAMRLVMRKLGVDLGAPTTAPPALVLMIVVSVAAAGLVHFFLEKPATRFLRGLVSRREEWRV